MTNDGVQQHVNAEMSICGGKSAQVAKDEQ